MKPDISVIIPVLNEAKFIGPLLESLYGCAGVEIIVVDGGSVDATLHEVRGMPSVRLLHSKPGRGIQLNCGAKVASGEILWFLHADSRIPNGWLEAIREILKIPGVVAGCFPLRFAEDQWLLRIFNACSRLNSPLFTYGDQGYFMKRLVFEEVGAFRDYPILEDVEIQCRLRALGSWKKAKLTLTTSARRFLATGILKQQLKNIGLVGLYLLGASPFWLSRFYLPEPLIQVSPTDQSSSRNPADLNEPAKRKGRFTRFPFWARSCKASFFAMVGSLSFKPKAR